MAENTSPQGLSTGDKFEILEQLNLHQRYIDNDASRESAQKYVDLYWPEGKMLVHDLRTETFEGPVGLKKMYDYAHSVFPLHKWRHSLGAFVIDGAGNAATVEWNWVVAWREGHDGTVTTGTYSDKFEKRNGQWKCLERKSDIDKNWPNDLFQPFIDLAEKTYKES